MIMDHLKWIAVGVCATLMPDPSASDSVTLEERFTSTPPVRYSMRLVGGMENWRSARTLCRSVSESDLAKILSHVQNLAAQSLVLSVAASSKSISANDSTYNQGIPFSTNQPLERAWIGLRLNKTNTNFEWDSGCSSVYSNYCPNSRMSGCLAIREDGCWETVSCAQRIKYVLCEEPLQQCFRFPANPGGYCPLGFNYKCGSTCYYWGGLSRYGVGADPALTYEEAAHACQERDSSLVTVGNWKENHCLRGRVNGHLNFGSESPPWNPQHGGFWLRYSENVSETSARNDSLSTSFEAELPWTNWHPDEMLSRPGIGASNASCGLIGWMGLWRRVRRTDKHAYICQKEMSVHPEPKKELHYILAMVIVCVAGLFTVGFFLILGYVCCRNRLGPSIKKEPFYVTHDD